MTWKPGTMNQKRLGSSLRNLCDICGKRRGGGNPVDHSKCSKLRQQGLKG